MPTLSKNPVTVLAHHLADNIESKGHYQGDATVGGHYGKSCIVANDVFGSCWDDGVPEFLNALGERLGFTPLVTNDVLHYNVGYFIGWNDTTPTAEVLDTLRSL